MTDNSAEQGEGRDRLAAEPFTDAEWQAVYDAADFAYTEHADERAVLHRAAEKIRLRIALRSPVDPVQVGAGRVDPLAVLRELEWSGWDERFSSTDSSPMCPSCDGRQDAGHAPDCRLAAALSASPSVQPERVRHFKGGEYTVIGSGYGTGEGLPDVMVYMDGRGIIWVRPLAEWFEPVEWPDGEIRPRFIPAAAHQGGEPTEEAA